MADLDTLLKEAVERFNNLPKEKQLAMLMQQRQSWVDAELAMAQEDRAQTSVATLTAAAPFLQGVKVKALEWENSNPDRNDIWACLSDDAFEINRWWEDGNSYFEVGQNANVRHDTLEADKAAAQADYEAHILSAIEVAPSPRAQALEEAVRKHLKWFERFICDQDELNSSTPRKVAQNAQDAAEELRAAIRPLPASPGASE